MSRKTFAEALRAEQDAKANSDLTNLANAHEAVTLHIKELQELLEEIKSIADQIDSGEVVPLDVIQSVYHRAKGTPRRGL